MLLLGLLAAVAMVPALAEGEFGYPMHDAIIAAAASTKSRYLSLNDMRRIVKCRKGDAALHQFEMEIPDILEKALALRQDSTGRILEYANETFSVGTNYVLHLSFVTVACVITYPRHPDIAEAAYAGQILAYDSAANVLFEDPDPRAYNLTMLLEADVVELPVNSLLFVPKRYCLDMRDVKNNTGVLLGGDTSLGSSAVARLTRLISLGTRASSISAYMNRVTWLDKTISYDSDINIIRRAYGQPKAEVLAVCHLIENRICFNITGTLPEILSCVYSEARVWMHSRGLLEPVSDDQILTALTQVSNMIITLQNWIGEKFKRFGGILGEAQSEAIETFKENERNSPPISPLLFDQSIAERSKNAPTFGNILVNPFLSKEEVRSRLVTPWAVGKRDLQCVMDLLPGLSSEPSAPESSTTVRYAAALRRRLKEKTQYPKTNVGSWSYYDFTSTTDLILQQNSPYMNQSIAWTKNREGMFDLQPGNLTNRTLGRTAVWLMASNWGANPELQDLLSTQQQSSIYSETSTEAVSLKNPCGEKAENGDVLLIALAMAFAAFGGVSSVVENIYRSRRWWKSTRIVAAMTRVLFKLRVSFTMTVLPTNASRSGAESLEAGTPTTPINQQNESQSGEDLPFFLELFGVLLFLCLYIPAIVQIAREFEVAKFETSAVGFEINYANPIIDLADLRGAFVTLVHAVSGCEDARPWLLVSLLTVFFLIGSLVNAPHFYRAFSSSQSSAMAVEENERDNLGAVNTSDTPPCSEPSSSPSASVVLSVRIHPSVSQPVSPQPSALHTSSDEASRHMSSASSQVDSVEWCSLGDFANTNQDEKLTCSLNLQFDRGSGVSEAGDGDAAPMHSNEASRHTPSAPMQVETVELHSLGDHTNVNQEEKESVSSNLQSDRGSGVSDAGDVDAALMHRAHSIEASRHSPSAPRQLNTIELRSLGDQANDNQEEKVRVSPNLQSDRGSDVREAGDGDAPRICCLTDATCHQK